MDNQLTIVAQQTGLEQNKVQSLLSRFGMFFEDAKKIADESKSIIVTDEAQTDLMIKAREKRLELKNIRVSTEKVRVELKEQSLREGRAIDGVANLIKALIVPVEQHLEKQEKFAEIREMERITKREVERISRLSQYVFDVSIYQIRDMSDVAFEELLSNCKTAHEATEQAKKKAEEDRIRALEKEKKEQEKIKKENERLKALREKDRVKMQKLREENERKEREEQKKIAEDQRIAKEKLLAEEKLKRAPDKEKYEVYVNALFNVQAPDVNDPVIKEKVLDIVRMLLQAKIDIKTL